MRKFRVPLGWFAVSVAAIFGCADASREPAANLMTGALPAAAAPPPPAIVLAEASGRTEAGGVGTPVPPAVPLKIIYNAQVDLVVDSVSGTAAELTRLVKENGGYISDTDVSSITQTQQQARWKARIPVDRFEAFLGAVSKLGELQKKHLDSQDVTQEFYDLEARIKNKQEEERRLLKHLSDSTGKLEDILTVEREITRVRGEIEQMQGRIKFLANVTSLSTVTISATEVQEYTPPVVATFGTEISRTFNNSVKLLTDVFKALVIAAAALAPWLVVALVIALPTWWLIRRAHRAARARPEAG